MRGKYPVSQWKEGDIIRDEHSIRLPVTWPADKMLVYVGIWRGNERMPVKTGTKDDGGRLQAAAIPVARTAPQATAGKRYVARKVAKPLKLDGKLDEQAWKDAPSTGVFVNTLTGGAADNKTEAKMLWDAQNLYLGFENADSDVWSTLSKRDDKLWTQEAVEIMIDADRNGKTYVEFQVAPTGQIFDTYLPEYRKYENAFDPKRKPYDWNSEDQGGGEGRRHRQYAQGSGQGLGGGDRHPAVRRGRPGRARGEDPAGAGRHLAVEHVPAGRARGQGGQRLGLVAAAGG